MVTKLSYKEAIIKYGMCITVSVAVIFALYTVIMHETVFSAHRQHSSQCNQFTTSSPEVQQCSFSIRGNQQETIENGVHMPTNIYMDELRAINSMQHVNPDAHRHHHDRQLHILRIADPAPALEQKSQHLKAADHCIEGHQRWLQLSGLEQLHGLSHCNVVLKAGDVAATLNQVLVSVHFP